MKFGSRIFLLNLAFFAFATSKIFHDDYSNLNEKASERRLSHVGKVKQGSGFFQISDVHLDPVYVSNSNTLLDQCRTPSNVTLNGGKYGRYMCDSPLELLNSALDQMVSIEPNPSFILMSGDTAAHRSTDKTLEDSFKLFYAAVKSKFPNTSVIPTLGNNDVDPDYAFSCGDKGYEKSLENIAKWWPDWIQPGFKKTGGLSVSPVKGLRVLSINTVMYSQRANNTELDPCGQFSWIKSELKRAVVYNETVYIHGHIPIGYDSFNQKTFWKDQYHYQFLKIVEEYSSVIYGSFWGHIHQDRQWYLEFEGNKTNGMFAILASAISPVYTNYPSLRYYDFDLESKSILNYKNYVLPLNEANKGLSANWTFEYDFSSAYKLPGISTKTIKALLKKVEENPNDFMKWRGRFQGGRFPEMWIDFCLSRYSNENDRNACIVDHTSYAI